MINTYDVLETMTNDDGSSSGWLLAPPALQLRRRIAHEPPYRSLGVANVQTTPTTVSGTMR